MGKQRGRCWLNLFYDRAFELGPVKADFYYLTISALVVVY